MRAEQIKVRQEREKERREREKVSKIICVFQKKNLKNVIKIAPHVAISGGRLRLIILVQLEKARKAAEEKARQEEEERKRKEAMANMSIHFGGYADRANQASIKISIEIFPQFFTKVFL